MSGASPTFSLLGSRLCCHGFAGWEGWREAMVTAVFPVTRVLGCTGSAIVGEVGRDWSGGHF